MTSPILAASWRPAREMQQKNTMMLHESFFSLKGVQDRPVSVATEFMESDFDDDEILSDFEDGNSPRASLNSGQPSFTTVSSYDEAQTPRSSRAPAAEVQIVLDAGKQVEGPRGPHLFRISALSSEFQNALSLSPLTPHAPKAGSDFQNVPLPLGVTPLPAKKPQSGPFRFTDEELDTAQLALWSPESVAQWMLNAGIELQVCERFVENDITGAILITLKFEDLKELGIPSFGVRTTLWHQVSEVKNIRAPEPRSETPIEDAPDRRVCRELRRHGSDRPRYRSESRHHRSESLQRRGDAQRSTPPPPVTAAAAVAASVARRSELRRQARSASQHSDEQTRRCRQPSHTPPRRRTSSRRKPGRGSEAITPLESVSIVGIEQLMPKQHVCSKGENCSKWKRSQRMIEAFKKEHPFADGGRETVGGGGGIIMIAGDPGNPQTAESIGPSQDEVFRPVSDAVPSVVASSDVMGPDTMPRTTAILQEDTLRAVQSRDPQDNVRQFLDFQHQHGVSSSEIPPTPPFELFPGRRQPHEGLRALPKLAIPTQARHSTAGGGRRMQPLSANSMSGHSMSAHPSLGSGGQLSSSKTETVPLSTATSYTHTAMEESPEQRTPTAVYRFGTPFSEMDVPVTAVPVGPVAREVSQSVPPDMNYRVAPARTMSRASGRRPSFPVLPALVENRQAMAGGGGGPGHGYPGHQRTQSAMGGRTTSTAAAYGHHSQSSSPASPPSAGATRPLLPPPRVKYPWSPERSTFEKAIAPLALMAQVGSGGSSGASSSSSSLASGASMSTGQTSAPSTGSLTVNRVAGPAGVAQAGKDTSAVGGVTYQGPVKKRKTKMLRHEWNERYVTLRGTRLAVHKDAAAIDRTLEYIDIDDYAIACSSMAASTSKLNAAFKAMNIRRGHAETLRSGSGGGGGGGGDVAAFAFQLIPQDAKGGVRLRKRESNLSSLHLSAATMASAAAMSGSGAATAPLTGPATPLPPVSEGAVNGTGKTHHFAVKSRDERIEWMRELMLAKAMRQKGEGFEVSVNGNMI